MDELDIRILRTLSSNPTIAPHSTRAKESLREIAKRLGMDDMTVGNRLKKLRQEGLLPKLRAIPNPGLYGYRMKALLVDLPAKSPKDEAIETLKQIHGAVVVTNFFGNALGLIAFYESDESLAKNIQLISQTANAEKITQIEMLFPPSATSHLTSTDWAIIRSLANDAVKSPEIVAKELGLTSRTVRSRLDKLQRERALMITGNTNIAAIGGMIPSILYYTYANRDLKSSVDKSVLSHFDGNYLWARLTDAQTGYIVLAVPNVRLVQEAESWAKQQPGIESARIEVVVNMFDLWDKAAKLFSKPAVVQSQAGPEALRST